MDSLHISKIVFYFINEVPNYILNDSFRQSNYTYNFSQIHVIIKIRNTLEDYKTIILQNQFIYARGKMFFDKSILNYVKRAGL